MKGFRPITWLKTVGNSHYFIDVRVDGSAHAAYLSGSKHEAVGSGFEDLGLAMLACATHEELQKKTQAAPESRICAVL